MTDRELQAAILAILRETPDKRVWLKDLFAQFDMCDAEARVRRCIGQLLAWERVTWNERGVRLAASVRSV